MRNIIAVLTLLLSISLTAQNNATRVYYNYYENGKGNPNSGISTTYSDGILYLSKPSSTIRYFMDFNNNQNVTILNYEDQQYCNLTSFDSLAIPTGKSKSDKIMGYDCYHVTYNVFSNKIEVWYTQEAAVYGSPYRNYLPENNALVLKVVINGNRKLVADSIVELQDYQPQDFQVNNCKLITDSELEELKIRSRYSTINIFNNDTINFDPDYWSEHKFNAETGVYHYSKGAVIMKKVSLPDNIDAGSNIFARLVCRSAGDAYDRTGSVFLITPSQKTSIQDALKDSLGVLPVYIDNNGKKYQGIVLTDEYNPPVELMRFFTSFGAGHFNKLREIANYPWKDEAIYKHEVTDVFPVNADEVWIGVFIGNYDRGGHRVSLDLDIYPAFSKNNNGDRFIQPLINTVNIMEMSNQEYGRLFNNDTLRTNFYLPDSLDDLKLVFTTTGHGGWGGGDEFNPKLNQVLIDGKVVFSVIPWRTDCATYRLYNPASGNFGNGMSSSDLSRSNWCPATLTPPYIINLKGLKSGEHTIEVTIDQGEDEGGSFNHWSVTGTLSGYYK